MPTTFFKVSMFALVVGCGSSSSGGAATPAMGSCFDAKACFGSSQMQSPTGCSFAAPGPVFNVATSTSGVLKVLDMGTDYTVTSGTVTLGQAICAAVTGGTSTVVTSTSCATKQASQPLCA